MRYVWVLRLPMSLFYRALADVLNRYNLVAVFTCTAGCRGVTLRKAHSCVVVIRAASESLVSLSIETISVSTCHISVNLVTFSLQLENQPYWSRYCIRANRGPSDVIVDTRYGLWTRRSHSIVSYAFPISTSWSWSDPSPCRLKSTKWANRHRF